MNRLCIWIILILVMIYLLHNKSFNIFEHFNGDDKITLENIVNSGEEVYLKCKIREIIYDNFKSNKTIKKIKPKVLSVVENEYYLSFFPMELCKGLTQLNECKSYIPVLTKEPIKTSVLNIKKIHKDMPGYLIYHKNKKDNLDYYLGQALNLQQKVPFLCGDRYNPTNLAINAFDIIETPDNKLLLQMKAHGKKWNVGKCTNKNSLCNHTGYEKRFIGKCISKGLKCKKLGGGEVVRLCLYKSTYEPNVNMNEENVELLFEMVSVNDFDGVKTGDDNGVSDDGGKILPIVDTLINDDDELDNF